MFDSKHYLQEDGAAQGPHMSCSYSDIAMYMYDLQALNHTPGVICRKRFRDDIFTVWNHFRSELDDFFSFLNSIHSNKKIQFTMSVANNDGLEFLDLKLCLDTISNRISVDVFAKPTNSFTYVLPSIFYPRKNIENVHVGVALRLRRICDSDEKFNLRSSEYQKYLIARDYKPHKVLRKFSRISSIPREEARRPKSKGDYKAFQLITEFNPILTDLNSVIKKHLPLLYCDADKKEIFPERSVKALYRRGKNLKEILSPSCYPIKKDQHHSCVSKCNGRCDLCKNFMEFSDTFKSMVTGKTKVNGSLNCNTKNVIYLITCKNCSEQYLGSAINFKERFRIHKNDIKQVRPGVVQLSIL